MGGELLTDRLLVKDSATNIRVFAVLYALHVLAS
jgi:hypothetical protein